MPTYDYCEELRVELDADGVLLATLNRPEKKNAFNAALRQAIRDLLRDAKSDERVRVLVFTGAGGAFGSGADLSDLSPWPSSTTEPLFAWCLDLLEMPKPTIAAISGVAAGGGLGLALLCDIRICSDTARLIPVWLQRAIHPDDLVTWTLPRLVGYSRALTWLYLAKDIPLDEAEQAGLINKRCTDDALMATTMELARTLAKAPTAHLALTKQAVLRGLSREPWDAAMIESWGQAKAFDTEDFREGIAAFHEKRRPVFRGR